MAAKSRLTGIQRIGLLLTGLLMAVCGLLLAVVPVRHVPAGEAPLPLGVDSVAADSVAVSKPKARKARRVKEPAPPPPARNHLDETI